MVGALRPKQARRHIRGALLCTGEARTIFAKRPVVIWDRYSSQQLRNAGPAKVARRLLPASGRAVCGTASGNASQAGRYSALGFIINDNVWLYCIISFMMMARSLELWMRYNMFYISFNNNIIYFIEVIMMIII